MADAKYSVELRDTTVASGFSKISRQITRSDKAVSKLDRRLKAFSAGVGRVAFRGLTAGVFAFGRILSSSITKFIAFDKGLRSANTLMRLSERELKAVGREVENFAVELGQPAEGLLAALKQFKSASFDARKSLELVGAAGKLAQAGFIGVDEAVGGLIAGINIFQISQEQLSNQIAATVEKGVLTFGKVGRFIQLTGLFAKQANLDLSETLTIIQKLTQPGVPANIAITQARAFLIDVGTDRTQARFRKELGSGIETDISKVGLQGISDILQFANELDRGTIGRIFINKRAKAAALGLANTTTDSIRTLIAFNRAAEQGTEFLDRQRDKAEGPFLDFARSTERINRSMRDLASQLTVDFADAIENVTDTLVDNSDQIKEAGMAFSDVAQFLLKAVPSTFNFLAGGLKKVAGFAVTTAGEGAEILGFDNTTTQTGRILATLGEIQTLEGLGRTSEANLLRKGLQDIQTGRDKFTPGITLQQLEADKAAKARAVENLKIEEFKRQKKEESREARRQATLKQIADQEAARQRNRLILAQNKASNAQKR